MATIPNTKVECPIAIIWPITEQCLKEVKNKPCGCLCLCTEFFNASNIPGLKYRLKIYPSKEKENGTWIFLFVKLPNDNKVEANYNISIESAKCVEKFEYVFEKSVGWGCKFCTSEELFDPEKRFLVNGKLTIKMDGILMVEKAMHVKDEPLGDHSDALCLSLWNHDDKDFTFIAEGKQIMAHKIVLAVQSPVYNRMFESGMKEARENKVTIEDFTFDIVEMAVKLCYHRSLVSHQPTLYERMKLLQFFDKYDIQPLKDTFESCLMSEIDTSTVCSIANASLLSNSVKLEEKCAEFLLDCLKNTKPIKDIDLLDEDFGKKLFKNAFCHVPSNIVL